MPGANIPLGPCQNPVCGYDGPEHVLGDDITTLWECVKCGSKMMYISPSDQPQVQEIVVSDNAEATQLNGG